MHEPVQRREQMFSLRFALMQDRRTRDVVRAFGSLKPMIRELYERAAARDSKLLELDDLYPSLLPDTFRFRVGAAEHKVASWLKLLQSVGLMGAFTAIAEAAEAEQLLPAVVERTGKLVLFGQGDAMPHYPLWHIYWPLKSRKPIKSISLALWQPWIKWAAALPTRELAPTPPAGMTGNERLLWDYLVEALGHAPTSGQAKLLASIDEETWVVASAEVLAEEVGLTVRQVRAAKASLIAMGAAAALPRRGNGAAWGVRLVTD